MECINALSRESFFALLRHRARKAALEGDQRRPIHHRLSSANTPAAQASRFIENCRRSSQHFLPIAAAQSTSSAKRLTIRLQRASLQPGSETQRLKPQHPCRLRRGHIAAPSS
jgi:hypothetical protein